MLIIEEINRGNPAQAFGEALSPLGVWTGRSGDEFTTFLEYFIDRDSN